MHTLTKSVSNQTKNVLTPTRTTEIWLAEFIYSCILFVAFVLLLLYILCCAYVCLQVCNIVLFKYLNPMDLV